MAEVGPIASCRDDPKQSVTQAAQQIAIDADLRRQACQCRVGERNGNCIGRQGYAGNQIAAQPGNTIFGQPTRRRETPKPFQSGPAVGQIRHMAGLYWMNLIRTRLSANRPFIIDLNLNNLHACGAACAGRRK